MIVEVDTDEMRTIAHNLKLRCEQYETYIRNLYFEMAKMNPEKAWVGVDQEAFQMLFEEREDQYKQIYSLWYEYAEILKTLANMLDATAEASRG